MKEIQRKWLRDLFKPVDYCHYFLWKALGSKDPITVTFKTAEKLAIRPKPTTDLATAYEIFIDRAYHKPATVPEPSPKLIVDVGANVGYSVIYWAYKYPEAKLIAFEPHPHHIAMLYRQLELNALLDRVRVVGTAVSNVKGEFFLTDNENESVVIESSEPNCLPVKVGDFFEEMGKITIDLLKMDIEGGEYPILQDKRFESLDVRMMVIEWHGTAEINDGKQWCSERLSSLGFELADGKLEYANAGILWAWKP